MRGESHEIYRFLHLLIVNSYTTAGLLNHFHHSHGIPILRLVAGSESTPLQLQEDREIFFLGDLNTYRELVPDSTIKVGVVDIRPKDVRRRCREVMKDKSSRYFARIRDG
jgi:hypothetical protein